MIKNNGMIPGLHLHDHSGKAYLNYCIGMDLGFGSFDCSLGGMGKGVGNLKMEHIVNPLENLELFDLLNSEKLLRMPSLIPGLITSALSATDYYAVMSEKLSIKPSIFAIFTDRSRCTESIFFSAR